jgi:hypothetical protein
MEALFSIVFLAASVIVLDTLTYKSFRDAFRKKGKI